MVPGTLVVSDGDQAEADQGHAHEPTTPGNGSCRPVSSLTVDGGGRVSDP
jgi:hypothetical protein